MTQAVARRWTGMSGLATVPGYVVMQSTTLCNLDCAYCYLPERAFNHRMSPAVSRAVAATVNRWADGSPYGVVWHGGEPLAVGRRVFADLVAPFESNIQHQIQTNATLIDDAWCEFFLENNVRVSVSVDGPPYRNTSRRNRAERPAFDMAAHGVDALRRHGIDFAVLSVISDPRPGQATELYRFLLDLGCDACGVGIEEREGVNSRPTAFGAAAVRGFWAELLAAWRAEPRIRVREIDWSLRYLAALVDGTADGMLPRRVNPVPAIGHDGAVVLLSPELAGFSDRRYGNFTSGNVLDRPLDELVAEAGTVGWVREYLDGVAACRDTCDYFGFCGGAQAGNRYFEHGRFDVTATNHCRNSKMLLLDGVLDHLRGHAGGYPDAGYPGGPVAAGSRGGSVPARDASARGVSVRGLSARGVPVHGVPASHAAALGSALVGSAPAGSVPTAAGLDAIGVDAVEVGILAGYADRLAPPAGEVFYDWNNRPR